MTATPLKRSVTQFDYRLGVPMLLYAATTYAALAQVAMPWFRSAGMYAAQLRRTADAIDRFVLRMQDESLAHTQYAPETVLDQRVWPILDISDPESGEPKKVWDPYPTYAVGAFDLGYRQQQCALAPPLCGISPWSRRALLQALPSLDR